MVTFALLTLELEKFPVEKCPTTKSRPLSSPGGQTLQPRRVLRPPLETLQHRALNALLNA